MEKKKKKNQNSKQEGGQDLNTTFSFIFCPDVKKSWLV
jgi:hypothetical protein